MTKLSNLFLLAALLMSTTAHIFEQKSIRTLRETLQHSMSVMEKQNSALKQQNEAIGSCTAALHRLTPKPKPAPKPEMEWEPPAPMPAGERKL